MTFPKKQEVGKWIMLDCGSPAFQTEFPNTGGTMNIKGKVLVWLLISKDMLCALESPGRLHITS